MRPGWPQQIITNLLILTLDRLSIQSGVKSDLYNVNTQPDVF